MTAQQEENFSIAKAIIINQICIEANEALRDYPQVYRQALKNRCKSLIDELEKRIPECDQAFKASEEYFTYSTERIEMLIPLLSGLRVDELTNLTDFTEAYKKDPEKCAKFLSEVLEVEIK